MRLPTACVVVVVLGLLSSATVAQDAPDDALTEAPLPTVPDDHPVRLDRTGIDWVLPFERASAISRKSGHPLLIKAVAFGTTKSGCW